MSLQLSWFNLRSKAERNTRSPAPSWWQRRILPAALNWNGFSSLRPHLTGTHSRTAALTRSIHDVERTEVSKNAAGLTRDLSWGTETCCCPCTELEPGWSLTWGSPSSSWRSNVLLSSGWLRRSDHYPGNLIVSWELQEGPKRRQQMITDKIWRRKCKGSILEQNLW